VAEPADVQLVERHVRAFNHGVRTAEWQPLVDLFSDDAELRFENVPVGPFVGRDAIRRAYDERPPDDELVLLGLQADGEHSLVAAFAWSRGGTGRMLIEHRRGAIERLTVVFDIGVGSTEPSK
jgi:hypothetical protein